jgi:hypothetical protein
MSVDFHQSTRRQNPENSRLKEKLMILNFVWDEEWRKW